MLYNFKEVADAYRVTRKFMEEKGGRGALEFPPYITFELSSVCNFRCKMCPNSYMTRDKKELDFNLFKKAIDEISHYGSLIRFIGYDEPLLYSKIKEAIKYVKEKGLLLHITTNGSLLNKTMVDVILDNQVDSIIFSFQGLIKGEYCFMRNLSPEIYSRVINNIKLLYETRGGKGKKPYIKITTTITDRDLLADKDKFVEGYLDHADEVQVTGFTHFIHVAQRFGKAGIWEDLGIKEPQRIGHVNCFTPNYELLLKSSGSAHVCCGVYGDKDLMVGNIKDNSLFDIWHSEKANCIRKLLNSGQLDNFENCAVCPIRYKYENIDSAVINTRKDKVERFTK